MERIGDTMKNIKTLTKKAQQKLNKIVQNIQDKWRIYILKQIKLEYNEILIDINMFKEHYDSLTEDERCSVVLSNEYEDLINIENKHIVRWI